MEKTRGYLTLCTIASLVLIMAVAFYYRVILPFGAVFDGPWIKLTGIDAYFYMRLVDNLVHNFPHLISFDPYSIYPGGGYPGDIRFFAFMIAGIVRLLGGAAPAQQAVDTIAVYVPAVLGVLTVIPIYFIARALAGRWAGLVAAAASAILPGEFLNRSMLGFTDHHITEVFFTTFFVLFFVLALQHSRQFSYRSLKEGRFPPLSRHIPYSFIAGIFMGLYLISWRGSLMFLLMVFVFFVIQFVSDHLRGFPTDYLSKVAITCFLIALLIYVPVLRDKATLLALGAVILTPIVLNVLSFVMSARGVKPVCYAVAVALMLGLGVLGAWLVFPDFLKQVARNTGSVFSWKFTQVTESEMKSLFLPGGVFSFESAWAQFGLALYLGLAGLAVLLYRAVRRGIPELIFTAVWSIVMMLAAFGLTRLSAYLSVCLAVLTGYLAGVIIEAVYAGRSQAVVAKHTRKKRKAETERSTNTSRLALSIVTVVVLLAMLVPGASIAAAQAGNPSHAPQEAWMEALDWLRANSPEPFGSADYYYALYNEPSAGKPYVYPDTFYSVIIWSDYGYWLTRAGRRVPMANPGGTKGRATRYFASQDVGASSKLVKGWRARYVIADNRIASPNDKFYALAGLSGRQESDYYELCWQQKEGKYVPLLVFYPDYYRTMVVRLYNFDGKAVTPASTLVMAWQERQLPDGQKFKEITELKKLRSYTEAEAFIKGQVQGDYRIIGTDPLVSPVPLEALTAYHPVYQSEETAGVGSPAQLPAIKIFEIKKD
ncbi:MAG: oligosaccharyl transferase, archaeosortase A system-associated [Dehalococcoidia bacterium]|jgi:dolichyl-diphosphooligosaccharide--protein glycosyltransferase